MKKILLLLLVVFFISGCTTMKQRAIKKCKESGADTVQMGSSDGSASVVPTYGLGTVFTSSNSTLATYNCERLLKDEKTNTP